MVGSAICALLLAAPSSGGGKTTATMAIAGALSRGNGLIQCFKCGPDYVDPGFLAEASGNPCPNLDTWLMGEDGVRAVFARHMQNHDVALIEGVMGLLDGRGNGSLEGSSLAVAKALGVPILLVLPCQGMGDTIAAIVDGLVRAAKRHGVHIVGVLATQVGSKTHAALLQKALAREGLPPLCAYLLRDERLVLPARQLGLVPAAETQDLASTQAYLAKALDADALNAILEVADTIKRPAPPQALRLPDCGKGQTIAIAKDEAFCFAYLENLKALEAAGWKLAFFSPLRDAHLPQCQALYLPGGYPEVFACDLAANGQLRSEIALAAASGLPIWAECGGYMYLARELKTTDGKRHAMCGVLNAKARMGSRLRSLGYRQARLEKPGPFGLGYTSLRGHEFHWSSMELGETYPPLCQVKQTNGTWKNSGVIAGPCGNVCAGYVHFWWATGERS